MARPDSIIEYPGVPYLARGVYRQADTTQNPYRREDSTFLEAVKTGDPSKIRSDYSDAVRSLEISLAANESADTG